LLILANVKFSARIFFVVRDSQRGCGTGLWPVHASHRLAPRAALWDRSLTCPRKSQTCATRAAIRSLA